MHLARTKNVARATFAIWRAHFKPCRLALFELKTASLKSAFFDDNFYALVHSKGVYGWSEGQTSTLSGCKSPYAKCLYDQKYY